jgi:NADPH-dependent 2,4-dienoyl-CoA reductase/sulfur reductase-like enzyme
MNQADVVIVGAGPAGATAAGTLRHEGFDGRIVMIRGEEGLPYNRTTVNKAMLQGLVTREAATLPEASTPDIEWADVDPVTGLDTAARAITLASGRSLTYRHLIISTGSSPRPFPGEVIGSDVNERLVTLRTAVDADRLRRWVSRREDNGGELNVTILGAGLIGAETADVLAAKGARVRLVSRSAAPTSEHVGGIVARHLATLHQRHVEVHFGETIERAELDDGHVIATLTNGEQLRSDIVLVSIGVEPATSWLQHSGLDASDGVAVDSALRVRGALGVYAAGDVARLTDNYGIGHRIEHWNHAIAQGKHAARAVLHDVGAHDDPGPFDQLPTYTTRLYGTRLTIVGHPQTFAHETIVDGNTDDGRFTVALSDEHERLVGAIGVGSARTANALKPAIRSHDPLDSAAKLVGE